MIKETIDVYFTITSRIQMDFDTVRSKFYDYRLYQAVCVELPVRLDIPNGLDFTKSEMTNCRIVSIDGKQNKEIVRLSVVEEI
jgi:hypothetical protein